MDTLKCKVENKTKLQPKFKIGNRVFNKVTRQWVNIIDFDTETGLYVVQYNDGMKGRSLENELSEWLVKE